MYIRRLNCKGKIRKTLQHIKAADAKAGDAREAYKQAALDMTKEGVLNIRYLRILKPEHFTDLKECFKTVPLDQVLEISEDHLDTDILFNGAETYLKKPFIEDRLSASENKKSFEQLIQEKI